MDIVVSGSIELSDGSPLYTAVQRQKANTIVPLPVNTNHPKKVAIGKKDWLSIGRFPIDSLATLIENDDDQEADPFDTLAPPQNVFSSLKVVQAPAAISEYFSGQVFDLSGVFKSVGLDIKDHHFAGYDPATQCVFLYSSDPQEHDNFDTLFYIRHSGIYSGIAVSSRGSRQMRLVCTSGNTAILKSIDPESNQTRHLKIEPILGNNPAFVDLTVIYEEKLGEQNLNSVDTAATLETGKFLSLMDKNSPDESIEFKVEKLNMNSQQLR